MILSVMVLSALLIGACSAVPSAMLSQGAADTLHQAVEAIEAPAQEPEQSTSAPAVQVPSDPGSIAAYENTLTSVYELVNPSVVNISVKVAASAAQFDLEGMPELPFDMPGLPQMPELPGQPDSEPFGYGMGSGFVWDQSGHIVTNNHVVQDAVEIRVTFADGSSFPAELVGADPYSDLAVIKVEAPAETLRPIQMGDSRQLKVGELAIAIGNPFGLDGTMTVGIVSALGRSLPASEGMGFSGPVFSIPDVIQTDAPINPGNSGGVLVDEQGTLIGVPTAIESSSGVNAGIGFAVPADTVQRVVPVLIEDGAYQHAYLGISGTSLNPALAEAMDLEPNQRGALVTEVISEGPADEAGLRGSDRQVEIDGQPVMVGGDIITAIDGQAVRDMDDLIAYLTSSTSVGQQVTLTVLREGKELEINVTLGARPGSSAEPQTQAPRQAQSKARMGIVGGTLTPEAAESMGLPADQAGVLVDEVEAGGPADKAGLLSGDVITALNGEPVESIEGLVALLGEYLPGDTVRLTILREGESMKLRVTLEEMPG
jgi:S1-C subfamily serine protease